MSVIVKLLSDSPYTASELNPQINTKYETYGIITDVYVYDEDIVDSTYTVSNLENLLNILHKTSKYVNYINVLWNNGSQNSYNLSDLCLYDKDYENDGSYVQLQNIMTTKKNTFKSIW